MNNQDNILKKSINSEELLESAKFAIRNLFWTSVIWVDLVLLIVKHAT